MKPALVGARYCYPLFISGPARPRDKQWSQHHRRPCPWRARAAWCWRDRARSQKGEVFKEGSGSGWFVVASGTVRRRSRQAVPRPRVVQFSLTEEEFGEVSLAAQRSGLARGAFAAEAALASARGAQAGVWSPLREALVEVMTAAGLVRRAGTNLNQAVARLNATGQRGEDLVPAAQFWVRVIRRLDEAAEQLRRTGWPPGCAPPGKLSWPTPAGQ
jgi:hypothetical protein